MVGPSAGPEDTERARTLWFALLLTVSNGFMDAHTFVVRGGVFANVQTGNVIFAAIDAAEGRLHATLSHVWPILAFVVGMLLASHIKTVPLWLLMFYLFSRERTYRRYAHG